MIIVLIFVADVLVATLATMVAIDITKILVRWLHGRRF